LIKEGDVFEKSIGDFLLDWFDQNFMSIYRLQTTEPKLTRNEQAKYG
jgi:hypothetical protein